MNRLILTTIAIWSLAVNAWAAGCDGILSLTRDVTFDQESILVARGIKSNYCSGSSVNSSKNFSFGLGTQLGKVPLDLKLGSGSNRERVEHICSNFDSWATKNADRVSGAVSTKDRAIEAWESCIEITSGGEVQYDIQYGNEVLIVGIRRGDRIVTLNGATFGKDKLSCHGPFGWNGAKKVVTDNLNFQLKDDLSYPMTCTRLSQSGNTFPAVDLAISVQQKSLIIPLPKNEFDDDTSLLEVKAQLSSAQAKLATQMGEITELTNEIISLKAARRCSDIQTRFLAERLRTAWPLWKIISETHANHSRRRQLVRVFMGEEVADSSTNLEITKPELDAVLKDLLFMIRGKTGCP
ncbi:MAG: hypothetical protein AAGK03_03750 [Pseudomonadota bacterium]